MAFGLVVTQLLFLWARQQGFSSSYGARSSFYHKNILMRMVKEKGMECVGGKRGFVIRVIWRFGRCKIFM